MAERFFIADTHFGHRGMVKFARPGGGAVRPIWGRVDPDMSDEEAYERVAQMNEDMIDRWNAVVNPGDKVDILGDVTIGRRPLLEVIPRLNGKKRLRSGNHDLYHKDYPKLFKEITAYKVYDGFLCSHIPVHPSEIARWGGNLHGHLHTERVMRHRQWIESGQIHMVSEIDPDYLCVSAEHTDFAPISMDEVRERFAKQREEMCNV